MDYTEPLDAGRLLHGCHQEAERSRVVAFNLEGLRNSLAENYHAHINALAEEVRNTSNILRDIVDRSNHFVSRVCLILDYLNVGLPCLSRSLRDITTFYEDRSIPKEMRWRKMYHKMTSEAEGLPLPQRFSLYNHYLTVLLQLLTRDFNFDLNTLEFQKNRILELREKRGIAPPAAAAGPLVKQDVMMMAMMAPGFEPNVHWAEQIFSQPLPSRTTLKHHASDLSVSYGPHMQWNSRLLPGDAKILFRRTFDNDRLSLITYENGVNKVPYVMLRTYHMGSQWCSTKGTNEICIKRNRSAIELRRWSRKEGTAKLWAKLYFVTWEEMVLFFCTFVSLKARNKMTLQISPDEYKLHGEKLMFAAQIIDDGYKHSLHVYQDKETQGTRLHAAVWDGELRQSPAWTAFVTHQSASPTWLVQKSKHRIWIKDVQLYVFCQGYRQQNQRPGRGGEFELRFAAENAATKFKELFYPPSPASQSSGEKRAGPS